MANCIHAQITIKPNVESQKTKFVDIALVATSKHVTIVDIDLLKLFQRGLAVWVSLNSETTLSYQDPKTGEIISLKPIAVQRYFKCSGKFVSANFDTRYILTDFGEAPVTPVLRLIFPEIENGVNNISIKESGGRKAWYWNHIKIRRVEKRFDYTPEEIENKISNTKNVYAGKYERLDNSFQLAFFQDNGVYYLVINDDNHLGRSLGETLMVLRETAYPNVYFGESWDTGVCDKVSVTFEDGVMSVKDEHNVRQYIKMKGTDSKKIEPEKGSGWSGSGFALKDGYVVTNYHVVNDAKSIEIYGVNGSFGKGYKASVVGVDKISDLALLKIVENANFENPPYSFYSPMLDVGENIYVLGYPLIQSMGEEIKLTNGIISSRSGFEGDITTYQISAPIQPGNSGGPMFDLQGRLVGIVCAKHSGAENVGYAIKTSYLKNLVETVSSDLILPIHEGTVDDELKEQVKVLKKCVYMIRCSK
ncbi:MAG: trypsin-like peptidase domain-containing protein [Bacteroidaceae bacterium]|nr:trypsin-like peptidase domain-containing protein [Bacteroidaceae bacterium]